jgi:hypothetical protein
MFLKLNVVYLVLILFQLLYYDFLDTAILQLLLLNQSLSVFVFDSLVEQQNIAGGYLRNTY